MAKRSVADRRDESIESSGRGQRMNAASRAQNHVAHGREDRWRRNDV